MMSLVAMMDYLGSTIDIVNHNVKSTISETKHKLINERGCNKNDDDDNHRRTATSKSKKEPFLYNYAEERKKHEMEWKEKIAREATSFDEDDLEDIVKWLEEFSDELNDESSKIAIDDIIKFANTLSDEDVLTALESASEDDEWFERLEDLEASLLSGLAVIADKYPFIKEYIKSEEVSLTNKCPNGAVSDLDWIIQLMSKHIEGKEKVSVDEFKKLIDMLSMNDVKEAIKKHDETHKDSAQKLQDTIEDCVNDLISSRKYRDIYDKKEKEIQEYNKKKLEEHVTFSEAVNENNNAPLASLMVKIRDASKDASTGTK